jgi:putative Mg2+ transporter-C (MgtC) family protein
MDLTYELERQAVQLGKLLLAYGLVFPMAWDREQADRSLGMRTFPLVAVASCAFVLVAQSGFQAEAQALSRVLQGIIAGVGFLGVGAIVKTGATVRGAATAAAVWLTAALGVAVAESEYAVAAGLGFIGFATLRWLRPLKRVARKDKDVVILEHGLADEEEDEDDDDEAASERDDVRTRPGGRPPRDR